MQQRSNARKQAEGLHKTIVSFVKKGLFYVKKTAKLEPCRIRFERGHTTFATSHLLKRLTSPATWNNLTIFQFGRFPAPGV